MASGIGYPSVMDTATEAAVAPTIPSLTLADRCDKCKAQAFVVATFTSGHDLLLCNHHGVEFEPSLVAQGASIYRKPIGIRVNDTDH